MVPVTSTLLTTVLPTQRPFLSPHLRWHVTTLAAAGYFLLLNTLFSVDVHELLCPSSPPISQASPFQLPYLLSLFMHPTFAGWHSFGFDPGLPSLLLLLCLSQIWTCRSLGTPPGCSEIVRGNHFYAGLQAEVKGTNLQVRWSNDMGLTAFISLLLSWAFSH